MRLWATLLVSCAVLTPAAFSQKAPSPTPTRKAGWWEMKMAVKGPSTPVRPMVLHICTDPSVDRYQSPFGVHSGKTCPPVQVSRTPKGWTIHSACTMGAMKIVTDGTTSGNLQSHYEVDLVTRMIPPPQPDLAEIKTHVDATWLGACPAGKKPGDLEMNTNVAPNSH